MHNKPHCMFITKEDNLATYLSHAKPEYGNLLRMSSLSVLYLYFYFFKYSFTQATGLLLVHCKKPP